MTNTLAGTPTWTSWNPPPDPVRDLWWEAQRRNAPDVDDLTERHRRGFIRLPWTIGPERGWVEGALVDAWVCCDPACAGVEPSLAVLEINHGCCRPTRCCAEHAKTHVPARRHMAGSGSVHFTGYYHGPFTAWWEPGLIEGVPS